MPESRGRKKPATYTPPPRTGGSTPAPSPRWLVPAMIACFVIGLLWIVVWYLVIGSGAVRVPGLTALGPWNLVIGFAWLLAGFVLATRWR